MKKLFRKFYGFNYETLAQIIFGYLFMFICAPFVLPHWLAKSSYIKVNKMHGYNDYGSDPDNTGVLYLHIITGLLALVSIVNLFAPPAETIPSIIYVITYVYGCVIVPIIYFLANVRMDYEKQPKVKKEKTLKVSDITTEQKPNFYDSLNEFKQHEKVI